METGASIYQDPFESVSIPMLFNLVKNGVKDMGMFSHIYLSFLDHYLKYLVERWLHNYQVLH